ncbi:sorting nexin-27-like isoform X4 [Rhopilema esculentum]|uniref:sorting nexin-27-like isoform X4 n=1 Tax=Rhopilema esculentum TaxID=499914 RepID=UPI0031D2C8AE|eukprot:gene5829-11139_t
MADSGSDRGSIGDHESDAGASQNNPYEPRNVVLKKGDRGFGFNVRGQVSEGGQLKSINGVLYPPLQMISAVLEGGPAEEAGIMIGDRILEVNKISVEGADHKRVVELIRQGKDTLEMVVISVTPSEARKLDGPADAAGPVDPYDYSERRGIPITIPDTRTEEAHGQKYVVYNIYVSGKYVCARRYREFAILCSELKKRFRDFSFPKFPGKWPFQLSDQQLDTRRRGLETFLEEAVSVRVMSESDIVQDFLKSEKPEPKQLTGDVNTELRIILPDRSMVLVNVQRSFKTQKVYEAVVRKIGLSDFSATFFALFEVKENGFDRKLEDTEFPHSIYVKTYKQSESKLIFKKWIFTLTKEVEMNEDEVAVNILFWQAIEDIRKNRIKIPDDQISHVKELQQTKNKINLLDVVRSFDGYGSIQFPHCLCDARKDGPIILSISLKNLQLKACQEDGTPLEQEHTFTWEEITSWEADEEAMNFMFEYQRAGKKPRQVRVRSPYYVYMQECIDRIKTEIGWFTKDGTNNLILPSNVGPTVGKVADITSSAISSRPTSKVKKVKENDDVNIGDGDL